MQSKRARVCDPNPLCADEPSPEAGRLKIADAILEARPLVEELLPFRVQITLTDHDTYEPWRERAHDDLVLARRPRLLVGRDLCGARMRRCSLAFLTIT